MEATKERPKMMQKFRVTGRNIFGEFNVVVEARDAKHALEVVREMLSRGLEVTKC